MGLIGGILLSILGLVAAMLSAVIVRLITDDIKEWLPRVKVRLIERAVRKLPEDQRERYAEEWSAFINETPGDLSKVIRAFGLGFAADSIAGLASSGARVFVVARTKRLTRRVIEIAIGLAMIILVAPIFVLIAVAIRLDGPGPVFFRQKHLGSGGKTVELLAFRTMDVGTDQDHPKMTRIG